MLEVTLYVCVCVMYRPKAERTYCTTNQECQLGGDAAASCALVGDFSLGISYGSVPCNLCPSSQPICLVTDSSGGSSGTVGVCTCLQQQTPLQSCARSDLSLRVVPDASQMCAVSLHAGASSRSVSALYDWNYLAAAPCVLISMSNAYCYEVNGYGLMVVGHGVVKTTSTLFADVTGGSSRRRLLEYVVEEKYSQARQRQEDEERALILADIASFQAWNHTAEPCSALVEEFVARASGRGVNGSAPIEVGSVLDMHTLKECVR